MSIEVFFNRPGRPLPIDRLITDIESAQGTIGIAAAWFTSTPIADAVIRSSATMKAIHLNQSDIARQGGAGRRILQRFYAAADADGDRVQWIISILGSGAFEEGIMHHKFVVIDGHIVWTGSYNLTYQASKNYETLIRFDDPDVGRQFVEEFTAIGAEGQLWESDAHGAIAQGIFRCAECRHLFPLDMLDSQIFSLVADGERVYLCTSCGQGVRDYRKEHPL